MVQEKKIISVIPQAASAESVVMEGESDEMWQTILMFQKICSFSKKVSTNEKLTKRAVDWTGLLFFDQAWLDYSSLPFICLPVNKH
jgi:hypothetical protein